GLLYETPTQQAERKLKAMAAAARNRDATAMFQHVSDDLRAYYRDKATLRTQAEQALQSGEVEGIGVWGLDDARFPPAAQGERAKGTIAFRLKVRGANLPNEVLLRCTATFVKDADGQWRLFDFELQNFQTGERLPMP